MRQRHVLMMLAVAGAAALATGHGDQAAEPRPQAVSFERDVQPILARCVHCHGPGKAAGKLRLDSRRAAVASGAIVPGKPDESELLARVADSGRKRMPPRGDLLSPAQVDTLRRWIAAGADWPEHWAYRPLVKPTPPATNAHPVDAFIRQALAERGLSPAPSADRRTLVRRVYFDLVGLPPTPAEMAAALADQADDWFEKIVDRLLASPHYGERWARHWMDVVHYAETHGHDQDRPREHAWPYRDYLIRAFNEDRPYARFVQEQVAGDVLFPDDPQALAATGFLATGPWDESSLRDIREDTLDRAIGRYLDRDDIVTTVMTTFVSTTVHCARCHDHKIDPVTQHEYYNLQAVFAGIDKANRAYDTDPQVAVRRRRLTEQQALLAKQKAAQDPALLAAEVQAEVAAWEKALTTSGGQWRVLEPTCLRSAEGVTLTRQADGSVLSSGPRPETDTYTVVAATDLETITGVRLEVLPDDSLPLKGPGRQDNGNLHLNEFRLSAAQRGQDAAQPVAWQSAKADFDQEGWTSAHAIDGKPATAWGIYPKIGTAHSAVFTLKQPLRHAGGSTLTFVLEQTHGRGHLIGRFRLAVTGAPKPGEATTLPKDVAAALAVRPAERSDRQKADLAAHYLAEKLSRDLAALPAPQLVYCGTNRFQADGSFRPTTTPRPVHLLERGDVTKPKDLAAPGALSCVPGLEPRFALADANDEGNRRAALARWLSNPRNGLAWRSMANRVWQHHFGRGLVDTPNDFGRMGAAPTHPELLDWLAVTLQENGGSLKKLHRLIVTSATYRQAVRHDAAHAARDADNAYLWRMNRRRLDAESIHDAVLHASGKLDPKMGGPSVRQFIQTPGIHVTPNVDYQNFDVDAPGNFRRSVYRFVFRTLPDPFMEALDCPDGSQQTPVRGASVTALQALALLNDKFIVRQSQHLADRIGKEESDAGKQVEQMYQRILQRPPTAKEAQAVTVYVQKHGLANACRLLWNSNEFMFVE